MSQVKALTIGLLSSGMALLTLIPAYATQSDSVNFYYQAGANQFSSGVLSYELDFSEFLCDPSGTIDCNAGNPFEVINVTGLNYVTSFSATFSGLSFSPASKTFTKNDLTDFSIYIDRFGNFWSTPSFIGDNIYTNEVPLITGTPLPPSEDGWQATVDFLNGQTLYTADSPNFPIPEPLTILGASTAIAFGAGFKRRIKKSD